MKRYFLILVLAFVAAEISAQSSWERANQAYSDGNYSQAIDIYSSIADSGKVSAKLYYNLGNSYYKNNEIGKALASFYKAERLDPSDEDIKHNIILAESKIKDNLAIAPEFFIKTWLRDVRKSLSSNAWTYLSIIFFIMALASVLVYLLFSELKFRKTGFYVGLISLFLFICSTIFAIEQRRDFFNPREAVIITSASSIKSSPDPTASEVYILHEGTKVRIEREIGSWIEVKTSDGNKGWIRDNEIERIK